MPYQPTLNFKTSSGTDLGNLGWITKEYLMTVYPQIANQLITPELWIWGRDDYAQLGNNTATLRIPTPITTFAGGANWKQVASSHRALYTAAIKTDGTLWSWGRNFFGQLGVNDTTQRNTPVTTFSGGTNWKQIACGENHTAAIKTDGTLWTWGYNDNGQLGVNDANSRTTPVTTVAGGTNWKQVAGGRTHTAAVKTDGTLWTWGANSIGQLADNTGTQKLTPITTFAGGTNWKQIDCGNNYTAAIKTDGTLWVWGQNDYMTLGDNTTTNRSTPVTTFAGGTNWKQVACGYRHTTAIKTDGTLWSWGRNYNGQLGDNTKTNRSTPVTTFSGGTNWKQIACGENHTAAIKTDGTLWTWGQLLYGQLGNGNTSNLPSGSVIVPSTPSLSSTNWKQVTCGQGHTAAIKTSDDLQGI